MNVKTMVRILGLLLLIAAFFALQALYQQAMLLKSKDLKPRRKVETRVIYNVPPDFAQRLAEQAEANRRSAEGRNLPEAEETPPAEEPEKPAPKAVEPLRDD